jgi:hypothetical protein
MGKWLISIWSRCCWLIPMYTYDKEEAATAFEICSQRGTQDHKDDLAKGSEGDCRYVLSVNDTREMAKIVEVKLLRSNTILMPDEISSIVGPHWHVLCFVDNRDIECPLLSGLDRPAISMRDLDTRVCTSSGALRFFSKSKCDKLVCVLV